MGQVSVRLIVADAQSSKRRRANLTETKGNHSDRPSPPLTHLLRSCHRVLRRVSVSLTFSVGLWEICFEKRVGVVMGVSLEAPFHAYVGYQACSYGEGSGREGHKEPSQSSKRRSVIRCRWPIMLDVDGAKPIDRPCQPFIQSDLR